MMTLFLACGLLDSDELVAFLELDGDKAGLAVGDELGESGLLDGSLLGDADEELVCLGLIQPDDCGDLSVDIRLGSSRWEFPWLCVILRGSRRP